MSRAAWRQGAMALVGLALLLLPATPFRAAEVQPQLTGDTRIHDPSVIEVGGRYAAFGTGEQGLYRGAILVKTSPDGMNWTDAGAIGKGVPKWALDALGYQPINIWAPSISRRGGTFLLYYALSAFGGNASAIGLMTNASFDPLKPGDGWQDQGLVLKSNPRDDFNAIDPFRIDLSDGRAFLAFGSFWSGIKLRELNPATGKLVEDDTPTFALAGRHGGAVEAPSILEHDGKFYLFVSFDQCCKGRGLHLQHSRRPGGAHRGSLPRPGRQGHDAGRRIARAGHDRPLYRSGRAGARQDSQRRHARLPLL